MLKLCFLVISFFFSLHLQAYDYEAEVHIHNFNQNYTKDEIDQEIRRAQKYFDKCKVKLAVKTYKTSYDPLFNEWETYWFNNDKISEFELVLAQPQFQNPVNIIFLDSINWTINGQGTWAVAYAGYLATELPPNDVSYLNNHMHGTIVMGRYRARWTLAHELGHLLFGLRHSASPRNVMQTGTGFDPPQFDSNGLYISNRQPRFTPEQCRVGISQANFLHKL